MSINYRDQFRLSVERYFPVPEYVGADQAGEMLFLVKIPRNDADLVIGSERRVWEANASSMFAALNAASNYPYFTVWASLEEFDMPSVGPTNQHRASSGVD